MVLTP
jgi:Ca2+-binding EF-hand superfamily protein